MSTHLRIARALPRYVAPTGSSYSAAVLADSPAAYYRLGEASGTTAADSSGNGRDATISGSITFGATGATTDGNTAVTLSGGIAEIDGSADSGLNPTGSALTAECWVNFTNSSATALVAFCKAASSSSYQFLIYSTSGKIGANVWAASNKSVTSASTYNDGAWHHVALVYDGANILLYIDGTQVATTTQTGGVSNATTTTYLLRVGGRTGSYFSGSVDECAYYKTALSSTRVAAHYAAR